MIAALRVVMGAVMSDEPFDDAAARRWLSERIARGQQVPAQDMAYDVGGVSVRVRGAHTALVLIPNRAASGEEDGS